MTTGDFFEIKDIDRRALQSERERVLCALRNLVPFASVFEVGSTAVEGVIGKQDIDFVVRVPRDRFDSTRRILDSNFPRNPEQLSTQEYQGYVVPSSMDVAIQLIVENGKHDDFHVFAQLLASNRDVREAYNQLKARWHGRPMQEYRLAKQRFIESSLREYPRAHVIETTKDSRHD
jgi:GrpB-like predicted nucleotidyltransferase (UPF0157 family)